MAEKKQGKVRFVRIRGKVVPIRDDRAASSGRGSGGRKRRREISGKQASKMDPDDFHIGTRKTSKEQRFKAGAMGAGVGSVVGLLGTMGSKSKALRVGAAALGGAVLGAAQWRHKAKAKDYYFYKQK